MNEMTKAILWIVGCLVILFGLFSTLLRGHTISVLEPKGHIAREELNLIIIALVLSAVVVVPVFLLLIYIVANFRDGSKKHYSPDWDHDGRLEAIWWGIPLVIISILSVVTWQSSHALDPFRKISSSQRPLQVQVIALQWKWLFIYPDQKIATVNYLHIPTDQPVEFSITSDAPMNSFWIPQLGGQIYAMSGMATHLSLIAEQPGAYYGSSANISGEGFARMHFKTIAEPQKEFRKWVVEHQSPEPKLDLDAYTILKKPSTASQMTFGSAVPGLFDATVIKYVVPNHDARDGAGTRKIHIGANS